MNKSMNVFQYAAVCERMFETNLANVGNYQRQTSFYSDLSIAEYYNEASVKDTYKRVMKHWIDNVKYITEFILSLNWKCWEHHGRNNESLCKLYHDLYYDAQDKFYEYYKDDKEALDYYYQITD